MKLLVDVNLSPRWIDFLVSSGFDAMHWTVVGDPRAEDSELIDWARAESCVIFTHDLDFSRILALTGASGPSVFQVRTEDVLPQAIGERVVDALRQHAEALQEGAIVVLEPDASRSRILPIR